MTSLQALRDNRRNQPKQSRSIKTVETLLDTTAELLGEVGFSSFTTNLLSERTGISIRAIYRYFPNKHALVMELALRLTHDWQTEEAEHGVTYLADPKIDWRHTWPDYLDRFVSTVRERKGGTAIMHAMRSDPVLKQLDDEIHEEYMRDVAACFIARDPSISTKDAHALASVLIKSAVAIISSTLDEPQQNGILLLAMLKTMHLKLMETYLKQ